MDKKSNMKRALYEMFGFGESPEVRANYAAEDGMDLTVNAKPQEVVQKPIQPVAAGQPAASFLAPGTTFEGSLVARGDIEIAGSFKGTLTTDGEVCLRSDIQSDIKAKNVRLFDSNLTGDITASGTVIISENSRVTGNITANELHCAGEVNGNLQAADSVYLEAKSRVNGDITTGAIAVDRGALINGRVDVRAAKPVHSDNGKKPAASEPKAEANKGEPQNNKH